MAQVKLISLSDFTEDTIALPESMEESRITTAIDEAQNTDLKQLLGSAQYSDLIINKAQSKYTTLLNGETYTNSKGQSIIFPGLKFALIYWTMAHFTLRQQSTFTTHGFVNKRDERSDAVDSKEKARQVQQFKAVAMSYWSDVETYMTEKRSTYPLFKSNCSTSSRSSIKLNPPIGD